MFSYLADTLGSTVALADDSGALTTEYTYEPFAATSLSGQPSPNPFQFTGRENDGIGLYYSRARYLQTMHGRLISEDPIGISGGINLYVYVLNNPTRLKDPLGLQPQACPEDKCREEADREYRKCIAGIERLETGYRMLCLTLAALSGIGTGVVVSPGVGVGVAAIGAVGCLTYSWEELAFPAGRAGCGFLRQRVYDMCKASKGG